MKSIFASKTFWTNVIAIGAIIAQGMTGTELPITAEQQAALLGLVNIVLRLISKDAVSITGS